MYILYTICYCTSLGFPRVYVVFTIPYTRLGLYIFFYLYMIIQNTQYTDYSLCFSVLPSLKLTEVKIMTGRAGGLGALEGGVEGFLFS
jgi:hypothetical protein